MSEFTAKAHTAGDAAFETLDGERAAKMITSSVTEDLSVVGFDDVEASRLGVKLGQIVAVTPDDNGAFLNHTCSWTALNVGLGKVPTIGKLLALNKEEVTIETQGTAGAVRCHFPRLFYVVKPEVVSRL